MRKRVLIVSAFLFLIQAAAVSAAEFPYAIPYAIEPEDSIRLYLNEFPYREIHYPEVRLRIVASALSAIGKVPYFWGGKYDPDGLYPDWGEPFEVYSEGSPTTGTIRPYGLDCSGFVQWAFYDALGDDAGIGISTTSQWYATREIEFEEAIPGDLLFRREPGKGCNHVGIMIGRNQEGTAYVVHCNSAMNGVSVSEAEEVGLTMARRVDGLG